MEGTLRARRGPEAPGYLCPLTIEEIVLLADSTPNQFASDLTELRRNRGLWAALGARERPDSNWWLRPQTILPSKNFEIQLARTLTKYDTVEHGSKRKRKNFEGGEVGSAARETRFGFCLRASGPRLALFQMTMLEPIDRPKVEATLPASSLSAESLLELGRNYGSEGISKPAPGNIVPLKEMSWHIHAANYIALGMSAKDTAAACDCTDQEIYKLLRQPQFAERVAKKVAESHGDLLELFKAASLSAFSTLVEINSDTKAPTMARLKAATEILDRHLGKATQFMEIKSENTNLSAVERVKQLEGEVKHLAGDLKLLPASEASCEPQGSSSNNAA